MLHIITGNNVKLMTSRQKLAAIKKITCQEIKGILTERKSVIVQILLLFAASGSGIQQALEFECMNLAEALETNNPFTPTQTTYFSEWEDDFVIGMYPEKNDPGWICAVDAFREKILKNWSRVLVFAKFTQCSLEEAAVTILKLTLTRVRFNVSFHSDINVGNYSEQRTLLSIYRVRKILMFNGKCFTYSLNLKRL